MRCSRARTHCRRNGGRRLKTFRRELVHVDIDDSSHDPRTQTIADPVDAECLSGGFATIVAVNSRNARSCSYFKDLFCARNLGPRPACALYFVGRLRRFAGAFAADSAVAAYRLSGLGNSDGTAPMAVSADSRGELARREIRSSALPGWVPAPLSG